MPLPGSSQTGVRLARMLCQIPLLEAMDMKVRTCWSGKTNNQNIIFPLIFECRKIRNLPFWPNSERRLRFGAFHFSPTVGGSMAVRKTHWITGLIPRSSPFQKLQTPESTLRFEAAVGKSQPFYWRLKVPLRFIQIHPQTAFLCHKGTPAFRRLFFAKVTWEEVSSSSRSSTRMK